LAPAIGARIAAVTVAADYATTNYGSQNRSDDCARGRAAAYGAFVTTRRRTARIGYRDRLGTRRDWSRIIRDGFRRYRLGLVLRDGCRRFGLHDLRRGLGGWLVVSDASRRRWLASRRSGALNGRDHLRARIGGAVGEVNPIGRRGKRQIVLEIVVHRHFLVTAASGEKHGTRSCKQQITLPHKDSFPISGK
jgi:hypothetical protein